MDKMVDKSCDDETLEQMRGIISKQTGVLSIDMLHTRLFGAKMYVDIEISADGTLSLEEGHEIAQKVHDAIEKEFRRFCLRELLLRKRNLQHPLVYFYRSPAISRRRSCRC